MLLLRSNQLASSMYLYYLRNVENLEAASRRMATGERIPIAKDGGGEIGVADLFRQKIAVNDGLVSGLITSQNYLSLQGESLEQAGEILTTMSLLASDALDTTLTTADRIALDAEFQALEDEFYSLHNRRFNSLSIFNRSLTVRVGRESTDTTTLTGITLDRITFTAMTLSQLTLASAALISITDRIASLNLLRGRSGAKANMIARTLEFTRSVSVHLGYSEDAIRNIDLAIETGEFTKQQVILTSSQSVLSQVNNLIQSILQFLS
jgi:flagellin